VTKRIRRLAAGLSIAAAVATGTTLTTSGAAQPPDTTWGAPTDNSNCCLPGANPDNNSDSANTPPAVQNDTTWG
jgi:hypothetical protein